MKIVDRQLADKPRKYDRNPRPQPVLLSPFLARDILVGHHGCVKIVSGPRVIDGQSAPKLSIDISAQALVLT